MQNGAPAWKKYTTAGGGGSDKYQVLGEAYHPIPLRKKSAKKQVFLVQKLYYPQLC